jgi:hypothetical protein
MKTVTSRAMVAAIAMIVTAGCAGLIESSTYKFEIVGQPVATNAGRTLTVRMVNASNGQPVRNAEVFAVHAVFAPSLKALPSVQWVRTRLKPDGHGDYLYEATNLNAGEALRLTARVPGADAQIVGTVETGGRKSAPS